MMKLRSKVSVAAGLFLFMAVVSPLFLAAAQDHPQNTVFKIGEFDRSSIEFAPRIPQQKVNFIVSQSDPAKDWFREQSAILSSQLASADSSIAAAPRAITFSLDHSPARNYRLHLALLIEAPSVPALKVTINGKEGMFYLHPVLNYDEGDQQDSFDPVYASADVEFTFPGSYLHAGANTISLQLVEEATEEVPNASINYDAIELDSVSTAVPSNAFSAQIEPTVYFQQKDGELKEIVEAFFPYRKGSEAGSGVDLTIGAKHYHSAIEGGPDFGDAKAEFLVSAFDAKSEALLTVKMGGRTQQFKQAIDPGKKWTVLLVPHIHLDVGYSDYQAKVGAIQSRTIDEALDMIDHNPGFRFSLDGEWALEQFLATRSAAEQQRVIDAIQKKQLYVPAQYASLLTGLPTAETLIRSLYPSANFSTKYGTPLNYANITDVPTYSWSYASILAAAGIPDLFAGSDNYRAPVLLRGHLHQTSPMWWVGPDNQRVLLWYSRHYHQMRSLFGLPPITSAGRDTLSILFQNYSLPSYHANAVIAFGTQVENTDLFPQQSELAAKWNGIYAYPHIQYSGFYDALQNIAAQFGESIPTIRGDGGPYWEDGAASDALYLAMERRNEARALTAEKLGTLATIVTPTLRLDPAELDVMWKNMVLMEEHTFNSDNSVIHPSSMEAASQQAVKEQFAVNAAAEVDALTKRSMANLADAIPTGPGSFIVFNSLNWKRSALVSIELPKGNKIVDLETGQDVPCEFLFSATPRVPHVGFFGGRDFDRVRFLAQDVPAVGYKVYAIRRVPQSAAAAATTENESGAILENAYYKVQLDAETGAILSIYDKQLQRELVSQDSPYRFGQYLYVTGGDKEPNTLLEYSRAYPKPELEIHPAHGGRIVSITRTPFGQIARLESQNLNAPSIQTDVILFDGEKKIEIVADLDKTEVRNREAAYFAFPFAMKQPQFQYEIQTGVVDPAKDMYVGAGVEWFSAQHWISAQQDGVSGTVMPLDAPLLTLGDINRGAWPETFGDRPGTIFSYIMNNYWNTNYRAGQGGHFTFRYVITSAASTNAADLSRAGWEEMTPLEADMVTSQDKAVSQTSEDDMEGQPPVTGALANAGAGQNLNGKQQSFLNVDDPNLLLETWKPAQDGNGTILRFLDLGGAERTVTVRLSNRHLDHVWQTDALERGQTPVTTVGTDQFQFTVHPHEIVTLRAVEAAK